MVYDVKMSFYFKKQIFFFLSVVIQTQFFIVFFLQQNSRNQRNWSNLIFSPNIKNEEIKHSPLKQRVPHSCKHLEKKAIYKKKQRENWETKLLLLIHNFVRSNTFSFQDLLYVHIHKGSYFDRHQLTTMRDAILYFIQMLRVSKCTLKTK